MDGGTIEGGAVVSGATSGGAASGTVSGGASSAGTSGGVVSGGAVSSGGASSSGAVVSSGGASSAAAAAWRDDWRGAAAKGDDKLVKRLERYTSPEAAFEALFSAQDSIAKNGLRVALPENATPEQVAEYRAANGIPEAPDKYDVNLGNGHVWGDADKPLLTSFTKAAHDANVPPQYLKPMLGWYAQMEKSIADKRSEVDASFKNDSLAKLGEMYGADFKRNIKHVDQFLQSEDFPKDIRDKVLGARLSNGRIAGSDPEFIDFMYKMALWKNPIATVMGGNSEAQVKSAEARIAELTKMSGDPKSDYWKKGGTGKKLQDELLQLNDQLAKVKATQR